MWTQEKLETLSPLAVVTVEGEIYLVIAAANKKFYKVKVEEIKLEDWN